ncbi:ATP-binding cassette domain-containing protein [Curvivirga aplysinae]|uniref:ATP-binding cassette domain-containing protein n=1 Tax=Curvivirga aplysinae TaxID=2529852 RepID=UPI0012BD39F6|nr:ATP-binding cassette domain-containing protein [Curvivirga aplysinae]MTI10671.1 ATP-binding cassette domain-containing protein [Curvivirga aplysinae]
MSFSTKSIMPLTLENISYLAGHKKLLKNISCQFEAGNRYVILGPNGAGKSLLLRMCHGLIQPSEGQVRWHDTSRKDAAKYQAMVSQRTVMLRRSAYGNIDFALKARNIHKSARPDIIDRVIKRTGLGRVINEPARVLSLGEQQRLAIARAWALSPQVLFLDEPTASLDPPATHAIEELIQEISAEGTTVIMTSHDLGQSKRLATDAIFMFRGHLKEMAPAEQFFTQPTNDLAQAFINGELIWWQRRPDSDQAQATCTTLETEK